MIVSGHGPDEVVDDSGAYFVIDEDQRITEWSAQAVELTAIPASQALGFPCYEIVNGRNAHRGSVCQPECPAFSGLSHGRMTSECAFVVETDEAAHRRLRCELHSLPDSAGGAVGRLADITSGPAIDGTATDSRDRQQSESNPDILRALTAFANLATTLTPDDLENSLERALDLLRLATGADSAEIFLAEPSTHDMLLTAFRGPFGRAFFQRPRFVPGEGFPGLVWEQGTPIVSENLSHDQRFLREAIKREGFHVYLCVPLQVGSTVIGALCIGSRDESFASSEALRLLTWSSVPIAIAVQAGFLQASRLEFDQISETTAGLRDLDSLLLAVLRQARMLASADAGTITLFDRNSGVSVRHLSDGVDTGALVPCSESAPGDVECPALHDGHGVALWGPRRRWPLPCQQANRLGRSTACIPIRHRNEDLGLIQLVYRDVEPLPPTRHLSLLLEFAAHAGTMLSLVLDHADEPSRADRFVSGPVSMPESMTVSARPVARGAPDQPYLRVRCLGPFEIERQGKSLSPQVFKRRKALSLLKILILHAGTPVSKESLIEWLWPESETESGLNRLHGIVHALREVIEPLGAGHEWRLVHYDGDHYLFEPHEPCWIDLSEFRTSIAAGHQAEQAGDIPAALAAFDAAARLYRGDLFEEDRFEEWVLLDREHLKETYLATLQRVAAHYDRSGDHERAIDQYRQIVREDPLRESVQRQLIDALWRSGRRDEALMQFERFGRLLRNELGIEPLLETEKLVQRIRQESAS